MSYLIRQRRISTGLPSCFATLTAKWRSGIACSPRIPSRSFSGRAIEPWLTELGPVDVPQGLPQVPSFAVLDAQAADVDIGGLRLRVCSLEHLLEMKRASDRPRDRDDLESLESAQQIQDEKG